ncbi:MAG: OsmC family protein [Bacteroidota bacterium]
MSHKVSLSQIGEHWFDILQNGKKIRVDSSGDEGTTGVRPKALILSSLAGCTAIDVVDILKKMRVEYSDFRIDVAGELTEELPKVYHTIHLAYFIKLQSEEDKSKMEKAVNLSQEKYCGVTAMVKKFADLKVKIEYL